VELHRFEEPSHEGRLDKVTSVANPRLERPSITVTLAKDFAKAGIPRSWHLEIGLESELEIVKFTEQAYHGIMGKIGNN